MNEGISSPQGARFPYEDEPLIVLIILTIGDKLVGCWGLRLGLPIWTYVLDYAILFDKK